MKKLLSIGLVLALCMACVGAMAEGERRTYYEEVQLEEGFEFRIYGEDVQLKDAYGYRIYDYSLLEDGTAELLGFECQLRVLLNTGSDTRSDFGPDETLVIPDTLDGYPLTAIGDDVFSGCLYLATVVIPDGVTAIGNSAFARCRNLTGLVIPDSVTSIGDDAFKRCSDLTLTVGRGSYAEQYCIDNGLTYQYAE